MSRIISEICYISRVDSTRFCPNLSLYGSKPRFYDFRQFFSFFSDDFIKLLYCDYSAAELYYCELLKKAESSDSIIIIEE